ncbi:cupin domain-containing protein [Lineolata rhizophorae]|uniref:Cupin domain-containing protein n=1 Tax=Lineolata rhizophorae TaxID=578093 RepID=A0A6A6P1A2_9PEZI|nr:cupin domain-containing protein [Lineolata rhizophorae]
MPEMLISRASRAGASSILGQSAIPNAFSGNNVYIDPVLSSQGMSIANVNFAPCGRTAWHTHEDGQILRVLAGAGWVCDRGGKPVKINVGDIIWCPPGTTHWHGADDGSYMVHQAISFGGVEWLDKVADEEYGKKA